MLGALLFFISFSVFLTSDVMVNKTPDESGLIFCSQVLVLGCRTVQFRVKARADLQYFISDCTSFPLFSIPLIFFFGPQFYICFGLLLF